MRIRFRFAWVLFFFLIVLILSGDFAQISHAQIAAQNLTKNSKQSTTPSMARNFAENSASQRSEDAQQNATPISGQTVHEAYVNTAQVERDTKTWNPGTDPHPSVVRIVAFEKGAHSFGSGTYLGDYGKYGMIITNWHVVSDSVGLVQVHFPNGFASYAGIISYDRTWDLTLLAISKPTNCPIVSISKTTPKVRDPLWIAGYGSGKYRLVGGRCLRYIAPTELPQQFEFVEVSVDARLGDSGGPIFNQKGELAGVLFGSDHRNTAGSFCDRVWKFIEQSQQKIRTIPSEPESLFAAIEPGAPKRKLSEGAQLSHTEILNPMGPPDESFQADSSNGIVENPMYRGRDVMGNSRRSVSDIRETQQTRSLNDRLTFYPSFPDFRTPNKSGSSSVASSSAGLRSGESTRNEGVRERNQPNRSSDIRTASGRGGVNAVPGAMISGQAVSRINPGRYNEPSNEYGRTNAESTVVYPDGVSPGLTLSATPDNQVSSHHKANSASIGGLQRSQPSEKYAASISVPNSGNAFDGMSEQMGTEQTSKNPRTFFDVLKIIGIVIICFFVIFHLVKLMSIIEENGQQENS